MTTITGTEVMEVLRTLGELAWGKCAAIDGQEDRLSSPPVIVWRFKERDPRLESSIVKAVESFNGSVDWEIQFTGRNWVIAPKRVREFQEQRRYSIDVEALSALADEDPEFGRKANEDLLALAQKIKETVEVIQKIPISPDVKSVTEFLESDDSVAVRVRERVGRRSAKRNPTGSICEIAAELEKCRSIPQEDDQRLFAVKTVLAGSVAGGGSYRDSTDENDDEIEIMDLAEDLLEKLAEIWDNAE